MPHLPDLPGLYKEVDLDTLAISNFADEIQKKKIDKATDVPKANVAKVEVALPEEKESSGHPFVDALNEESNRTLTANMSPAYISTLDPVLDLFTDLKEGLAGSELEEKLNLAWAADPLSTLRIIYHARSIVDGKASRVSFYRCIPWLWKNHPRTLLFNIHLLPLSIGRLRLASKNKRQRLDGATAAVEEGAARTDDEDQTDIATVSGEEQTSAGNEKGDLDMSDEKNEVKTRSEKSQGYWKDLLAILVIVTKNLDANLVEEDLFTALHHLMVRPGSKRQNKYLKSRFKKSVSVKRPWKKNKPREAGTRIVNKDGVDYRNWPLEEQKAYNREKNRALLEAAITERRRVREAALERVTALLEKDKKYRTLHILIARLFGNQLHKDLQKLKSIQERAKQYKRSEFWIDPERFELSLAAKWAPTYRASHDRQTMICSSIARYTYWLAHDKRESDTSATEEEKVVWARHWLQGHVLTPLRAELEVPEVKMSAGRWNEIKYDRVPALCMKKNKKLFVTHDNENFAKFMAEVHLGKKKIAGGTLGPHELVEEARAIAGKTDEGEAKVNEIVKSVLNAQWDSLVKTIQDSVHNAVPAPTTATATADGEITSGDAAEKKTAESAAPNLDALSSCIAVCDVSGSMESGNYYGKENNKQTVVPMNASIGLSLLLAYLAKPPFNGHIITFHETPTIVKIDTEGPGRFCENVEEVEKMPWGGSTNFRSVFVDLLLPMARKHNIKREDMIKRIFVFSDMQFDCASDAQDWETDYQTIEREYKAAGYDVPQLVFWNLGGYVTKAVTAEQRGTVLLSGFSGSLMKSFMQGDMDDVNVTMEDGTVVKASANPVEYMNKALDKESYRRLKVID